MFLKKLYKFFADSFMKTIDFFEGLDTCPTWVLSLGLVVPAMPSWCSICDSR